MTLKGVFSLDITNVLREKGFKVTPQRLAVYSTLLATKEHPTAEMLFVKLLPYHPTMSLATVYKTVDILAQIGLVRILNTGEDSFRYDADMTEHAHVKCDVCSKVEDVLDIDITSVLRDVEKKTGYDVASKQIYMFGICPSCRKNIAN